MFISDWLLDIVVRLKKVTLKNLIWRTWQELNGHGSLLIDLILLLGFFQKDNLIRHMASHPQSGEGLKCGHCKASFNSRQVQNKISRLSFSIGATATIFQRAQFFAFLPLNELTFRRSVLLVHLKDAHGEKSGTASVLVPKVSESESPPAVAKIDLAKIGPPPPLVPIRPMMLPPSPASAPPPSPKPPVSRLPTAAEIISGAKISPQALVVRSNPLVAGKKIVHVGGQQQPASSSFKCQVGCRDFQ